MKSIPLFSRIPRRPVVRLMAAVLAPLITAPLLWAEDEAETGSEYLERIELRSVASLPGITLFSLHDPENDATFWIEIGETRNDLAAVSFDSESGLLTVRHGESEREIGLTNRRVIFAEGDDGEELSRREARREALEQRREEWREFRERWEAAAEEDDDIREISNHFEELRGEWRDLRRDMRDVDRDSDEFEALRDRGRQLRDEQRLLNRYASQTIANHPDFTEEDAERANRVMQGINRRRGR